MSRDSRLRKIEAELNDLLNMADRGRTLPHHVEDYTTLVELRAEILHELDTAGKLRGSLDYLLSAYADDLADQLYNYGVDR